MNRRLIALDEVHHHQQEFLWGGRLPVGALTVFDGMPGDGKSLVLYDVAGRLTAGRPLPGCNPPHARCGVVLLQGEDDAGSVVKPRLLAAGADPTRIRLFDRLRFGPEPLILPADIPLVESAIAEIGAKLLVIDPLSSFLEKSASNEREMRRLLSPLTELAERRQVAIIAVRHFTKGASRSAMYRGTGSVAIIGLARAGLLVGPDPDSDNQFRHVIAQFKSNLGHCAALRYETIRKRDGNLIVEWRGECHVAAAELLGSVRGPDQRTQLEEAKYVLYSLLAERPLSAQMVLQSAKQAGIAERTLRRAKHELRVKSRRVGSGSGSSWFWQLPDDPILLQPMRDREIDALVDDLLHGPPDTALRQETHDPFRQDRFGDWNEDDDSFSWDP